MTDSTVEYNNMKMDVLSMMTQVQEYQEIQDIDWRSMEEETNL